MEMTYKEIKQMQEDKRKRRMVIRDEQKGINKYETILKDEKKHLKLLKHQEIIGKRF